MRGFAQAVVDAVKWFLENFVYILTAIGAASVLVRSFDELVEKMIEKHPKVRLWVYLDRVLDSGEGIIGWIINVLHKIALRKPQQ